MRGREQDDESRGWLRRWWWLLMLALPLLGVGLVLAMVVMITVSAFNGQGATADVLMARHGDAAGCGSSVSTAGTQGSGAAPAAGGGDGRLTAEQIAGHATAAGFTGEDLAIAVAVARAESGGRPNAVNGANTNGSTDYGLWQINSVHEVKGFDPDRAFDPAYNAAWARRVFMDAGGRWTPWTAYKNGDYLDHMLEAAQAVGNGTAAASAAPGSCGALTIASGFAAGIEPYQPYDGQDTCDPSPKPGVTAFANELLETYPVRETVGISRPCHVGGRSEHKEGRAIDWGVDVNVPDQRAAAEDALNRILATDEHGNPHALFRRLGLMYIIWNRQIIYSHEIEQGWQPYSCDGSPSNCHTNHVHFSFSWAGALARTSYFTANPTR